MPHAAWGLPGVDPPALASPTIYHVYALTQDGFGRKSQKGKDDRSNVAGMKARTNQSQRELDYFLERQKGSTPGDAARRTCSQVSAVR